MLRFHSSLVLTRRFSLRLFARVLLPQNFPTVLLKMPKRCLTPEETVFTQSFQVLWWWTGFSRLRARKQLLWGWSSSAIRSDSLWGHMSLLNWCMCSKGASAKGFQSVNSPKFCTERVFSLLVPEEADSFGFIRPGFEVCLWHFSYYSNTRRGKWHIICCVHSSENSIPKIQQQLDCISFNQYL